MTVVSFSRAVLPEIVYYVHGEAMTRSDMVARFFGRSHQQILLHIDALKPDLPMRWCECNFLQLRVSSHPADACSGKPQAYQMTRDGFTLLAMSFSGKKAPQLKLAYLDQFNKVQSLPPAATGEHGQRAISPAADKE
ncbi:Rha family transcriptional regulator [Herbaspirillum autotrophicum]|uniref:Rha family transcriptional regulator n=1 Tax=Herbaspirillum autotrophicum TaxID=180195 RepID=UPI000A585885|nr:Rha family transcriptional regulator [Herbaspirillum autotrophicum]